MDDKARQFLESNHSTIMVTLKQDGTPHVARVDVGLVGDKLQSSGTESRVRTKHLRRDPRTVLCVLDNENPYAWLGIEAEATILDGPDAPERNLALYRAIAGEPEDLDEYLGAMRAEGRLVYEFDAKRTYGPY